MNNLFDLSGKTALVTGSSRGIGKAIAIGLAHHGANVVISSRNQAPCDEVAALINARRASSAIAVAANISRRAELKELVERARARFGGVDVLVCNAASNPHFGPMASITDEKFEKTLRNNVLSNLWLTQIVVPEMVSRRDGSIIFISSIGGFRGSSDIGAYNISKAADMQMARNLAVEYGGSNIRVNCVAPGLINTGFSRVLWSDEANLASALSGTPLKRMGEPEDIAGAVICLASGAGRYITGQTIVVDGGATITVGGSGSALRQPLVAGSIDGSF